MNKVAITGLISIGLIGCSVQPVAQFEAANTHCARYMIYDMCAHDVDRDGVTDYFFFADDDQVFLTRSGFSPSDRPPHVCMQTMGPKLQVIANNVLDPDVQADPVRTRATKQGLLTEYLKLFPRISTCQVKNGRGPENADDFLSN